MIIRLIPFLILFQATLAVAQSPHGKGAWHQKLQPKVIQQSNYAVEPGGVILKMDFARHKIHNPNAVEGVQEVVKRVDLVYTRYPYHLQEWEVGYDSLMERRYTELNKLLPRAFDGHPVEWRLVLQTDCHNMEEAKSLLHGFCIYSGPAREEELTRGGEKELSEETTVKLPVGPPPSRFDSVDLIGNYERGIELFLGEETFYDSTCQEIFKRNPQWGSKVLIIDWTASMYRHGAQVMHWIEKVGKEEEVLGIVFFNDGDNKWDNEKVVGETGGIYTVDGFDHDSIMSAMERVSFGGSGGDHRENDLEAVREAMDLYPEADEFILIADNSGPVRDMGLLPEIERPLRIILCGVYHDRYEADYLSIAYQTKSSIHTSDIDMVDLSKLGNFQVLEFAETSYILHQGKFKKIKR